MRKILTSVLSVAGLLAVVLAIASGPAAAQTAVVVTLTTDNVPGTYTISWETQGSCDPTMRDSSTSNATDGATGSYSRTVAVPGGTPPTATVDDQDDLDGAAGDTLIGEPAEFAVVTASHCRYTWDASFVSGLPGDKGVRCTVAEGVRDGDITPVDNAAFTENGFTYDVQADECTVMGLIHVLVNPTATIDDPTTTEYEGTYTPDGRYLPTNPTVGAVLSSEFSVTAGPVKNSDDECEAVTKETEVATGDPDTRNDDRVVVTIQVIQTTLENIADCDYDVVTALPDGFAAPGRTNEGKVTNFVVTPDMQLVRNADGDGNEEVPTSPALCGAEVSTAAGVDTIAGNDDDVKVTVSGDPCETPSVTVAVRSVYITQSVVGDATKVDSRYTVSVDDDDVDSGVVRNALSANARYTLTEDHKCGIPDDLPANLRGTGGISTIPSVTIVELREGYHNISTAVMSPTGLDEAGRYRAQRLALNYEADPCVVNAEVSHLPASCTAAVALQSADLTTGVDAKGRAIMRFDIACDETGGGAMDDSAADDMDDGADDMDDSADDMDDSADAMGPPEDIATG